MRITILGCGDVGLALARHWSLDPALQLVLTTTRDERRPELEPLAEQVAVLRADDAEALLGALAGSAVAVLCLAPCGDRQVDAEAYAATYRDSMRALRQVLPQLPGLRQIVYTGSSAVYGDAAGGWVDEETPVQPRDDHGRVLHESEQLLLSCRSPERRVCVLRLGAIHGPGRQLAHRFRRLAGSTLPGGGAQHSNWIHRDDVVGAIAAAVAHGWDGVVNVVDDEPMPVAELTQLVCRAAGLEPVRWDPGDATASAPPNRRIRNDRLRQLGYELRHPRRTLPRLRSIDQDLFDAVAEQARSTPRLRRHHNLHAEADGVQRFLNVLQPGSYVRPHRHRREQAGTGFECFLVLQGRIGLLVFDDNGEVIQQECLAADGPLRGLELAEDQFHTLVALSPDAVIFELKQGPYHPATDKEFHSRFPLEDSAEAIPLEEGWRRLFGETPAGC
jgi:cupin fold WbuC family metalloprotein